MNAPLPPQPRIEFIDLKAQYAALRDDIALRMQKVLDHGQYIMGPEVKELETALAAPLQGHAEVACPNSADRYRLDGAVLSLI